MASSLPSPDRPRRISVGTGQIALSALDYGQPAHPGSDTPVLVLHGSTDLAWSMHPIARHLALTHRVVSLDLRGHGESPHPGAYSQLHYVADLAGALEHLGWRRPILVGHSMGGHTISQFAALHPGAAAALVLLEGLGPPARLPPNDPATQDEMAREALTMLRAPARHRPYPDVTAAAARLREVHPSLDEATADRLATEGTCPGPDGGVIWRFDPRVRDWATSVDSRLTVRRWTAVDCPVLAISGGAAWETYWTVRMSPAALEHRRFRLGDEELAERLRAFADLEHVTLDGAGHMIHFDRPDEVNRIVEDFVDRRVRAAEPPAPSTT